MTKITLADIPQLWRGETLAARDDTRVPTGFDVLDRALGGGWPRPALIELLCDAHGIGELRLLLRLLRPASHLEPAQRPLVLWLSPPFEVHATALAQYGLAPRDHWVCALSNTNDLQWAMTQALRSGACLAVIAWARQLKPAALRSLKLAALTGRGVGVLFRPTSAAQMASAATLRIALRAQDTLLELSILKIQGRRPCVVQLTPAAIDVTSR